ncbi:hypothetical protein GIY23_05405 [Allosaccharopolyspora coralli]|uniref:Uncharacterized protein n=1 Tax=Allosaccharopolyspora coralli TaxID=2665642 RepID=A0A5Q3Q379_9PSEU|nr:hypothetical protein [Allosaccharopolyspora coralli]QGK69048.1 hypothetical protein GIY23_05405 [Allosaccharopolyspora coralli]
MLERHALIHSFRAGEDTRNGHSGPRGSSGVYWLLALSMLVWAALFGTAILMWWRGGYARGVRRTTPRAQDGPRHSISRRRHRVRAL